MQNTFNDKSILAAFCMQASELCSAGLPAEEWLKTAAEETDSREQQEVLQKMASEAYDGAPVWQTFKNAGIFPHYMVEMIKNGECTGSLDKVLADLSEYYEREDETGKTISSALLYPAMMAELILLMITVIMLKVMPLFIKVYSGLGASFPAAAGQAVRAGGILALILFFAVGIALIYSIRTEKEGKESFFTRFFTENARIRSLREAEILCSSLAASNRCGMLNAEGADMAYATVGESNASDKLKKFCKDIKEENELWKAFDACGIIGKVDTQMVRSGERTGTLDETFEKIAVKYHAKWMEELEKRINAIEPAFVIILTVVIAIVTVMVLLPLSQVLAGAV